MTSLNHSHEKTPAQVRDLLVNAEINPTPQRLQIASLLFRRPQHISAEEVLAQVNRDKSLVSKATVYNTLNLFVEKGIIREVLVDPSRIFYDSNTLEHHHMYNMDTGELTDIAASQISINPLPELPEGQVLESVDLIVKVRSR